ncbi:hypothetical protein CAPTEDRAFT_190671 [Capitella teleta]|uniref:Glycosyltransferase 61 catalytic domain-containing protein n=1 Tax=Capitella teleta TaxID=283909 RepID=R7T5X7_CAPTE|nr:hypothetical protein CAPTEDRAFT_190671 [Capitella teleta]|eukprot:ELT88859.1 hypothetical protein CAPTEDRAFT_190671 [Capitella teleta]
MRCALRASLLCVLLFQLCLIAYIVMKNQSHPKWTAHPAVHVGYIVSILDNLKEYHTRSKLLVNAPGNNIILKYPDFKYTIPHFISVEDEDMFKHHHDDDLNTNRDYDHLTGIIHTENFSKSAISSECGWTRLLHENSNSNQPIKNIPRYDVIRQNSNGPMRDRDILVPLFVPQGYTYQHFIDGVLPKLMQIRPILHLRHLKFILEYPPRRDHAIVWQILLKLGIQRSRIIYKSELQEFNELPLLLDTCVTPPIHPILLNIARDSIGINNHEYIDYVILISRIGSHNPGRRIINKRETVHFLKERFPKNFFVFKGSTDLDKHASLFARTKLMIGVHGAGLYNMLLCNSKTTILEIMPIDKGSLLPNLSTDIFWKMASSIGQNYWRIYVERIDSHSNVNIPLKTMIKFLSLANITNKN